LFAASTSTRPSQVWPMLAMRQETGAHHRMEKSNSVVSSRSRDKFWSVIRCPQSSGSQLWREPSRDAVRSAKWLQQVWETESAACSQAGPSPDRHRSARRRTCFLQPELRRLLGTASQSQSMLRLWQIRRAAPVLIRGGRRVAGPARGSDHREPNPSEILLCARPARERELRAAPRWRLIF
jgi:hypothetical protein